MKKLNEFEERISKIAHALGSGGRSFSTEDVQKVDKFITEAEYGYTLSNMILDGKIHVAFDKDGELCFTDDVNKILSK